MPVLIRLGREALFRTMPFQRLIAGSPAPITSLHPGASQTGICRHKCATWASLGTRSWWVKCFKP